MFRLTSQAQKRAVTVNDYESLLRVNCQSEFGAPQKFLLQKITIRF
jgi:hypothetical protein